MLITNIIDEIAPKKKFRLKKGNNLPWIDRDCLYYITKRDISHRKAVLSGANRDSPEWQAFIDLRRSCKLFIRKKKEEYFSDKNSSFFRSSKNFWRFYKKFVKTNKAGKLNIDTITLKNGRSIYKNDEIAQEFNIFISDLSLPVIVSEQESIDFIDNSFNTLKVNNTLKISSIFKFNNTTPLEVLELIKGLDNSSSPGITGVPVKVIKHCAPSLSRIFCKFINKVIESGTIPNEWKYAIVTPLFKGKGASTNFDNYRGLSNSTNFDNYRSVLTPFGKIFEKIISLQVTRYFEDNNLFTNN